MIKRLREPFGSSAIALIQSNNIETRDPCFLSDSEHVAGVRRAFESVQKNDRRVLDRILLPVTFSADLRSRLDFKKPSRAGRKPREPASPERGGNRHRMRVTKPSRRNKFFHRIHGSSLRQSRNSAAGARFLISSHNTPRITFLIMRVKLRQLNRARAQRIRLG